MSRVRLVRYGVAAVLLGWFGAGPLFFSGSIVLAGELGTAPMQALSVVVLPLRNASSDPQQAYIADAITDYLTSDLSRIRGSLVIAYASAAAAASEQSSDEQIAHRLGVRYVLKGSTVAAGKTLRIDAELFDAEGSRSLWTTEVAGELGELPALRAKLVSRVAQSLDAGPGVPPDAAKAEPSAPESVDLLLRARSLLLQPQTAETMAAARRLLETVVQQDRRSAEAVGELASIHLAEALSGRSPDARQDLALAQELIDAAIAAEPGNPRTLALRGALLRLRKKPAEALAAYQAAIAANPSFADAQAEVGRLKIDVGQADDALGPIKTALQLSPLDPQRSLWSSFAGMALLYAGHPAEAIPWLEKSAALNPRFLNPQLWLVAAYALDGQGDKASRVLQTVLRLSPKLTVALVERQLDSGDPRGREQLSPILDALKRVGLPH